MALLVTAYYWGDAYGPQYVAKLFNGLRRNLKLGHRFLVVTDDVQRMKGLGLDAVEIPAEDRYLLKIPGCFARLRMFDPAWQRHIGVDDRVVNIDIDSVLTGLLDPLFIRPEDFVILQGGNAANPCPYGGALIMLRRGAHSHVWENFSLDRAKEAPFYSFPDDQGWMHHMVPGAAGWTAGPQSGIYVFAKPGWPKGSTQLPIGARIVTFNGWRTPEKFKDLDWVRKNW